MADHDLNVETSGKQTHAIAEQIHGTTGKRTFTSNSKTPASYEPKSR